MAATPIKFVAYYRVSTTKQGASGLGQDAQQAAARRHAELAGGSIVAEYTEVESGRKSNRQELKNALAHCRAAKATLLVAKLDRLARNVHFTSSLMESKVPFICADNPHATPFTIHILAAVAEQEAKDISDRTKAALAQARKRGVLLGSNRPGHWDDARRAGKRLAGAAVGNEASGAVRHAKAIVHHSTIVGEAAKLRATGLSWAAVAQHLNGMGLVTRRGNQWNAARIHEMMAGFGKELATGLASVATLSFSVG